MSTLAQWRNQLFYQPLSLGVIALITCAALVVANRATHPAIVAAEERDLHNSLSEVLVADWDNERFSAARETLPSWVTATKTCI